MPKLSVGMPVYNGAQYVARAIESVRAQTFSDFELVISDNASTDETEAICRAKAEQDSRIRYHRQELNLGSLANFEWVLKQASGEFFYWAAHDDQWHPEFASKAVAALERVPGAAGAMGTVRYYDADGREAHPLDTPPYHCDAADRSKRMLSYFRHGPTDTLIYGLYRRSALTGSPFVPSICPEKVIIAHALLQGPIIDVAGMEYTCLFIPKDAAAAARTIGIERYDFASEAAVYHGMVGLLKRGLTPLEFARVYPVFALKNNWHKFFAKRLLRSA